MNHLSEKNKGNPLESIELITHWYRISSHLAHGDEIGISLIQERKSQNEIERANIHNSHYLKLLSDCFHYCILTAFYTTQYLTLSSEYFVNLSKSLADIQNSIEHYQKSPFNDKIYDKFR